MLNVKDSQLNLDDVRLLALEKKLVAIVSDVDEDGEYTVTLAFENGFKIKFPIYNGFYICRPD